MSQEDLMTLRQINSIYEGHPTPVNSETRITKQWHALQFKIAFPSFFFKTFVKVGSLESGKIRRKIDFCFSLGLC